MDAVGSEDYRQPLSKSRLLQPLEDALKKSPGMKALLLALLLVCALCPDTAHSQNGVRLCGREFLRAVVYTCGGSRWRRFLPELSAEDSDLDGGQALGVAADTERLRRSLEGLPTRCCEVGCMKNDLARMC